MAKASYKVVDFGVTKYGEKAKKYILNGAGGVVLEVSDYGGKVVRLFTPDKKGKMKDVVVGFDSPAGWDNGDHHRPLRQPHREGPVQDGRQDDQAPRAQQRACGHWLQPPRRCARLERVRLGRGAVREGRQCRRRVHAHVARRRRGLPRQGRGQGHLHAHGEERLARRLRGGARQEDADQHDASTSTSRASRAARSRTTSSRSPPRR